MTQNELNSIFDRFLAENNGKKIERVDANALNQCFDLAIYWCEYLGFPKSIYSGLLNAYQIYTQWSNPAFEKIENDAAFVPKKGDTIVWSGSKPGTGGAGHVAVCTGVGDTNTFQAFSQNDPTGSPSVLKTYNYSYVLGVQRLKVTQSTMDRRPYWFDLINKVVWNKPYEQVTDVEVNKFVSEYPSQRSRSGKWDQLCIKAGLTGDSNQVTVDQLAAKLKAGFTQADIDAAYKKGRVAGINEVDTAVHKLLI